MPLYLIRWPGPVVSLVKAKSLRDLKRILADRPNPRYGRSENDNPPTEYHVERYTGHVALDFTLQVANATLERPDYVAEVGSLKGLENGPILDVYSQHSFVGHEMETKIYMWAFPAVDNAYLQIEKRLPGSGDMAWFSVPGAKALLRAGVEKELRPATLNARRSKDPGRRPRVGRRRGRAS